MSYRPAVQCSATAKGSGERCRKYATPGGRVCHTHGGAAGQVRRAAERRVVDAKLVAAASKYAQPRDDVTPSVALVEELRRAAGLVQWLENRVRDSDSPLTTQEWDRLGQERDRLTRLSSDLARLGIERTLVEAQLEEIRADETVRAAVASAQWMRSTLQLLGLGDDSYGSLLNATKAIVDVTHEAHRAHPDDPAAATQAARVAPMPAAMRQAVDEWRARYVARAEHDAALQAATSEAASLRAEVERLQAAAAARPRLALPAPARVLSLDEQLAEAAAGDDAVEVVEPTEVLPAKRRRPRSSGAAPWFEQRFGAGRIPTSAEDVAGRRGPL